MTFDEAMVEATSESTLHECTKCVNGRITVVVARDGTRVPVVDPNGWQVSDWFESGGTAAMFHRGQEELR